jgi:hypothetical protein
MYDRVVTGLVDRRVKNLGLGRSLWEILGIMTAGGCQRGEIGGWRGLEISRCTIRTK